MTTTTPLDPDLRAKKVRQITSLWEKANRDDGSVTPGEAAASVAKAEELQAKYGIGQDECDPRMRERINPLQDLFNAWARAGQEADAHKAAKARARADQRHRDQERRNQQARDAYAKSAREAPDEAWEPSAAHGTTTHRKNKSHQNCGHANTGSDRARCRRAGGPFDDSKLF